MVGSIARMEALYRELILKAERKRMKVVIVAGLPCAGKKLIIAKLISTFMSLGIKAAAARSDILPGKKNHFCGNEFETMKIKGFCNLICPGFYCLSTLKEVFEWAKIRKVEILFIEASVFFCSWIPYIKNIPIIMVIDSLRGMYTLSKMKYLLSLADTVIITKTDLVSTSETEILRSKIRLLQPSAPIVNISALSRKGLLTLKGIVKEFKEADELFEKEICSSMPVKCNGKGIKHGQIRKNYKERLADRCSSDKFLQGKSG